MGNSVSRRRQYHTQNQDIICWPWPSVELKGAEAWLWWVEKWVGSEEMEIANVVNTFKELWLWREMTEGEGWKGRQSISRQPEGDMGLRKFCFKIWDFNRFKYWCEGSNFYSQNMHVINYVYKTLSCSFSHVLATLWAVNHFAVVAVE